MGDPNSVLQIGNVTQYYRHKINLILVCDKNSFYQTKPRIKQLNWKISEKIFGTASMSAIGEVNIYFTDDQSTPYTTIEISTDKKTYKFPLNQSLTLKIDKTDCCSWIKLEIAFKFIPIISKHYHVNWLGRLLTNKSGCYTNIPILQS